MKTYTEKLEAAISKARSCYMSNAKWRKLFILIEEADISIPVTFWKFIADDHLYTKYGLPGNHDITETGIKDGSFQPSEFREIEYIQIPRFCEDPRNDPKRPLPQMELPIRRIIDTLNVMGKFPLFEKEKHLTIKGYEI